MEIEKVNQSKTILILTNSGTGLIVLFIIASFVNYYSMKLNLDNPLIPEDLFQMSVKPFLIKGMVLISGLIVLFILKSFKKNLFAFGLVILLIGYYIFSKHFIGG